MNSYGPILVYDKNYRNIPFVDGRDPRAFIAKLLLLMRSRGIDDADKFLRQLLFIPRNLTCVLPQFHIENFGPLRLLGTGGFGSVFQAEHKLDGRQYAIKIVQGIRSTKDLELARSEVSLMARLDHPNIIQYITSWIEYGFTYMRSRGEENASSSTSASSNSEFPAIVSSGDCSSASPDILEEPLEVSSSECPSQDMMNSHTSGRELVIRYTTKDSFLNTQHSPEPVLFIQLELCQYNLAQWLEHRNQHVVKANVSQHEDSSNFMERLVPHAPARWISDQLALGVAYLHENQMMHRDLKPENVLLSGPALQNLSDAPCDCKPTQAALPVPGGECYHQLSVKICDFGLARFLRGGAATLSRPSLSETPTACTSRDGLRSTSQHCVLEAPSPSSSALQGRSANSTIPPACPEMFLLTADLGSALYAAPEVSSQISTPVVHGRVQYDYKADVFSMGVIFLQLFHPFRTIHEFIHCLNPLENGEKIALPTWFRLSWPEESQLVDRMLDIRPENRPNARDVVSFLGPNSEVCNMPKNGHSPDAKEPYPESSLHSASEMLHLAQSNPHTHRLLDLLLWRNRELERQVAELRERLSTLE